MPLNKSLSVPFFFIHPIAAGIGRRREKEKQFWYDLYVRVIQEHIWPMRWTGLALCWLGTPVLRQSASCSAHQFLILLTPFLALCPHTAVPSSGSKADTEVFILLYSELHQAATLWKTVLLYAAKL